MKMSRSLEEIKVEMDLLCLDIENLQDGDKIVAVKHIEDSIRVIKLGSSLAFQLSSPVKRKKVDIEQTQSIMKTEATEVPRKFQNLYNGLVPTCDQCRDTFPTLATLDSHITKIHQQSNPSTKLETLKTEIKNGTSRESSPRSSQTKNGERNLQSNSRVAVKGFQCDFCDKTFGKKDSLNQHKICHTSKYECERCKHRFSEQRKLSKHLTNAENCKKYLGN